MKKLLATSAVLLAGTSTGWAQDACSKYTVQAGDSLSSIARTAYGDINYIGIFNANRDVIGNDPNRLRRGLTIQIPCADGSIASAPKPKPEVKEAAKVEDAKPAAKTAGRLNIRLTTAGGYKPFTDESLPGGGVYTQLVSAAAKSLEDEYNVTTTFVNDWGSHLESLVPSLAFDGAYPWTRPECEKDPAGLSDNSKWRCSEFVHTDPFYEIVNVLFVMKGTELETTGNSEDFHGKTVCLPDAYTDQTLRYHGLIEGETIELFRPVNEIECFEALLSGSIDAASLELQQGSDMAKALGASDEITANQKLLHLQPLNVFVSKDNPNKEVILEALNKGLKNIRDSGEWYSIVQEGLKNQ